ncbi:MAG: 16S rRNA (cytidine(1402)-2'-O)-methyltransferase [Patescibacteria group bacterium]|nr:16S rRNA (cytidine(1402)-2'-O)-methyltransferase [Patescibacteria group bacterium]MDE1946222.1 16S rRNA (cytidine(1402)-2'-O)-methyltransferase [Patescibacteria group bacterium]
MQKFYVVGTPIGNLEDVTHRAVRVLGEADIVLCEDTRVTAKLLARYGIAKPTMSYHSQSKLAKTEKILTLIEEGKTLALVSDAGTPAISDPGSMLVSKIRERFPNIEIIAIPGPSAVVSALSISGLPASEFLFLGFLPHKKGRETLFKEIAGSERTIVFYESPHRIMRTLASLAKYVPKKRVVIAREISKMYEETVAGTIAEIIAHFENHPEKARGEFVVMVGAK